MTTARDHAPGRAASAARRGHRHRALAWAAHLAAAALVGLAALPADAADSPPAASVAGTDELLTSPPLDQAALSLRASVWLRAADGAVGDQRKDEARQWLQRVAQCGAPQSAQAQARLKAL